MCDPSGKLSDLRQFYEVNEKDHFPDDLDRIDLEENDKLYKITCNGGKK